MTGPKVFVITEFHCYSKFYSSSTSVDSGLSISDLKKLNVSERSIFDKMMRRNATPMAKPAISKDVITGSDGITIDDEAIVKNMTQYRGKSVKEGTIDVYW